ncbi:alpha-amylase, putative [Aduncisulcus paluster]|uniref:Alpha-amylase, putative n=1 Tax=Aduncisulcus paluster TaxID=2918883 RepID=A0ABQ5KQ29_9EUKA|nr:alpha-amylase, putative [Aduncisulcus paluster]
MQLKAFVLIICLLMSASSVLAVTKEHRNLIELSSRPFFYKLSQQYGYDINFSNCPTEVWKHYQSYGITDIYFLGVWELGEYGLEHDRTDPGDISSYEEWLPDYTEDDIIGSPFAVVSYYTLNPVLGTLDDLASIRSYLNSIGIRVWLDFVPNHSAVDSVDMDNDREYFVTLPDGWTLDPTYWLDCGVAYGRDKYGSIWTDTAQYNYWNPDLVNHRIEELKFIAQYADGFRCDMAMLILNDVIADIWGDTMSANGYSRPSSEFWDTAISAVKSVYPNIEFMAEQYWNEDYALHDLGFDYCYDKEGLHDVLANGDLDDIRSYIWGRDQDLYWGTHFIENHDEDPAVDVFGSVTRADAAGFVTFLLPGMKFHFEGQWEGLSEKLLVQLRRREEEPNSDEAMNFYYTRLLPILRDYEYLYSGDFTPVSVSGTDSWRLLAWRFDGPGESILVVVNYSDTYGDGNIIIDNAASDDSGNVQLDEVVMGDVYSRSVSDLESSGLWVGIDAWWAQVFVYDNTE